MKRLLFTFFLSLAVILPFTISTLCAQEAQAYQEFRATIVNDLGLLPEEFRILDATVSNLLDKGISKQELHALLIEFKKEGLRRADFYKDPLDGLYGLLIRGQTAQEALKFLWQCIAAAQTDNLKGNGFVLKVTSDIQRKIAVIDKLRQAQSISNQREGKEGDKKFKPR